MLSTPIAVRRLLGADLRQWFDSLQSQAENNMGYLIATSGMEKISSYCHAPLSPRSTNRHGAIRCIREAA